MMRPGCWRRCSRGRCPGVFRAARRTHRTCRLPVARQSRLGTIKVMAIHFLGLDGEMTAADLAAGGRLCQVGLALALPDGGIDIFRSDIGWQPGDYHWEDQALAVNGFTHERIQAGPPPGDVDAAVLEWLRGHGIDLARRGQIVPTGWNVAGFDMPFVWHALPQASRAIGRRSHDLNSVCFLLHETVPYEGSQPKWSGWKKIAHRKAEERLSALGIAPAWHDAGYDAAASLAARDFLRSVTGSQSAPV
jgi:hypothetical protein